MGHVFATSLGPHSLGTRINGNNALEILKKLETKLRLSVFKSDNRSAVLQESPEGDRLRNGLQGDRVACDRDLGNN